MKAGEPVQSLHPDRATDLAERVMDFLCWELPLLAHCSTPISFFHTPILTRMVV